MSDISITASANSSRVNALINSSDGSITIPSGVATTSSIQLTTLSNELKLTNYTGFSPSNLDFSGVNASSGLILIPFPPLSPYNWGDSAGIPNFSLKYLGIPSMPYCEHFILPCSFIKFTSS